MNSPLINDIILRRKRGFMFSFILLFFPSFLSVYLERKLLAVKCIVDLILSYFIYCVINNIVVVGIFSTFLNNYHMILKKINSFGGVTIKYGMLSLFISFIFGMLGVIIKKNVGYSIEIKDKKNN